MILTLLEWTLRGTVWALSTSISAAYNWYWPTETLEQRVDRLARELQRKPDVD